MFVKWLGWGKQHNSWVEEEKASKELVDEEYDFLAAVEEKRSSLKDPNYTIPEDQNFKEEE